MPKRQKPENAVPFENEATRNKVCATSATYFTGKAEELHDRTGVSVAAVVVSQNEAQYRYSSAPMHAVLAQHGYHPVYPMANFRAVNNPNVQELTDAQLATLMMQTNAARAAIEAEQNQRGHN